MERAWIKTISPLESTGDILGVYQQITGENDPAKIERRIRNNFIALSLRPNLMESSWNFMHETSFKNQNSNLNKQEKDLIDTIVSINNRCRFCTIGHAESARGSNYPIAFTQQLKSDFTKLDISEKLKEALKFAKKLTSNPEHIVDEDRRNLLHSGWSEEDIIDIVHEIALFNYMNRIVIGLGVQLHPFMEKIEERDKEFLDTSNW
jgi:uncharacterized peroxidase-related enzyme